MPDETYKIEFNLSFDEVLPREASRGEVELLRTRIQRALNRELEDTYYVPKIVWTGTFKKEA